MSRQITLRLPFAWLTVRLEAPSGARHRSIFPVRHPPIDTTIESLRGRFDERQLQDIGIDRSRSD